MLKPDFSEAQLQAVVNIEIFRRLGGMVYPIVPSLVEENKLGWDSGFIIGKNPEAADQKGCNFFIQYKLATLIEGPRGGQYKYWNQPYFRFQIPHEKKHRNNGYYFDYHQYDLLRKLSKRRYPTFYVANSVTNSKELFASAQKNVDDALVMVNIQEINSQHRYVTFTKESKHVFLHSELKNADTYSLKNIGQILENAPRTSFRNDIGELYEIFGNILPNIGEISTKDISEVVIWVKLAQFIFYQTGIITYKSI